MIQVIDREESYTSKSSFLNQDPIPTYGEEHQTILVGTEALEPFTKLRVEVLIHADVNGALNIVRKHIKDAFEGLERNKFPSISTENHHHKNKNAKLKASA